MSTDSLQEDGVLKDESQVGAMDGQTLEDSAALGQMGQPRLTNLWRKIIVGAIAILTAVVFAIWGIHASQATDPYIQSVLQISGDPARGKDIFTLNCATCHGLEAAGEVGPDLNGVSERKSRVALITQVISGQTPPMPQFQPSEKDMADLLSFLETL